MSKHSRKKLSWFETSKLHRAYTHTCTCTTMTCSTHMHVHDEHSNRLRFEARTHAHVNMRAYARCTCEMDRFWFSLHFWFTLAGTQRALMLPNWGIQAQHLKVNYLRYVHTYLYTYHTISSSINNGFAPWTFDILSVFAAALCFKSQRWQISAILSSFCAPARTHACKSKLSHAQADILVCARTRTATYAHKNKNIHASKPGIYTPMKERIRGSQTQIVTTKC
jgi:hypothetical protein